MALFFVLQQIKGNFIYPRAVGNIVGLPPILVFVSVIQASSLMSIAGILISIPLISVMYTLTREFVISRKTHILLWRKNKLYTGSRMFITGLSVLFFDKTV